MAGNFQTLWKREWTACFLSPIAYVTMVMFLLLANWTFWNAVERHTGEVASLPLLWCMSVALWLPILITVITMRLFAEERRSGTIETLMTAPVTEWQVVLGKYAGALSFLLAVIAPTAASTIALYALSPGLRALNLGGLAGAALILLLLSLLCVAIGLLFSMTTRNQIIAAITCFCGIILPLLSGYLVKLLPFGSDRLVDYLLLEHHLEDFSRGSVDIRTVALYVSGTLFALFLAARALESRKWR
ncbi:MAG: ABC transporter permease subunit [Verrucomicrobiota bacterium]|nr:ABC transporter permease subunit [Verrucomicrobiota bacterium]